MSFVVVGEKSKYWTLLILNKESCRLNCQQFIKLKVEIEKVENKIQATMYTCKQCTPLTNIDSKPHVYWGSRSLIRTMDYHESREKVGGGDDQRSQITKVETQVHMNYETG